MSSHRMIFDIGIQNLKRRMTDVLKGECIHTRCKYILNLVVREDLKKNNDSIIKI